MVAAAQVQKLVEHNNQYGGGKSSKQEMKYALRWLDAYGYFQDALSDWKDITIGDIVDAVRKWQRMYHLKTDGYVGPKSLRAMQQPRCGCPDFHHKNRKDHAQYLAAQQRAKELSKWNKGNLTYYIQNRVSGISHSDFERVVAAAFQAWENHCQLNVVQTTESGASDIVIDVGEGRRSNFDGPGGTLAWAYLPPGDDSWLLMRFDLSETWVLSAAQRGILLFNVACHEFGHLLGLTHSRQQGALMAPYYNPAVAVPQMIDDIPRSWARYGKRVDKPPVVPEPPSGDLEYVLRCKNLVVEGYDLFAQN